MSDGDVLQIVSGHQAFAPGTGGGSISATDGTTTVDPATTMRSALVADGGSGIAVIGTAIVSATDPGAIGGGNLWARTDPGQNYGPMLYVRNAADNGWADLDGSGLLPGLVYYDDNNVIRAALFGYAGSQTLSLKTFDALGSAETTLQISNGVADLSGIVTALVTGANAVLTLDATQAKLQFDATHYVMVNGTTNIKLVAGAHELVLWSDGTFQFDGKPIGTRAAHVANGSTVDQLRDALIASGLMAAS